MVDSLLDHLSRSQRISEGITNFRLVFCYTIVHHHTFSHHFLHTELSLPPFPIPHHRLSIIPRRIKNVIPMPPDSIPLKQIREPQAHRNLFFRNQLIPILRLANNELPNLDLISPLPI